MRFKHSSNNEFWKTSLRRIFDLIKSIGFYELYVK